jgi:hypothetical protein
MADDVPYEEDFEEEHESEEDEENTDSLVERLQVAKYY